MMTFGASLQEHHLSLRVTKILIVPDSLVDVQHFLKYVYSAAFNVPMIHAVKYTFIHAEVCP